MKEIAEAITKNLSSAIEVIAASVIGIALIQFLYKYVRHLLSRTIKLPTKQSEFILEVL